MRKLKGLRPFLMLLAIALTVPVLQAQSFQVESFQGRDVVAGEILVRFRDGTVSPIQSISAEADVASAESVGRSGAVRLRARTRNVAALLEAYRNRADVLYAEPNYIFRAEDIPNDSLFGQQWALRNTGQAVDGVSGTSGADIKAYQAWDITEGSRNVVVGIVDSGVDYTHPDLAANVWSAPAPFTVTIGGQLISCAAGTHGFNAVARNCDPLDDFGHGTHVAGIVAGTGNNGAGVSGVNRIGSVMGLKFLNASGAGSTTDLIAAIDFAIQVKALFPTTANVRVLNNSYGYYSYGSLALRDEINLTIAVDILFVASAGNNTYSNELVGHYPSGFDLPNIVSVAATDSNDRLASFSNWGPTTVHLGAPGADIMSTLRNGTYGLQSGTSMATPVVAGAAALVLSACNLTTAQLRSNLLTNVDAIATLSGKSTSGGRVNVYRSITACAGATSPGFRISVTPGTQTTELNGSVNLTVTATSIGGFTGAISLAASGLPTGITAGFSSSTIAGGAGTSTLTLTTGGTASSGTYVITITGTSGARTSSTAVVLTVGTTIATGQTISGTLTTSDQASPQETARYADYYRFTLSSQTAVTIDLKSRAFDTFLYLLSSTGTTLTSNDDSGGDGNSRITMTLSAGTYFLEVTSQYDNATGAYYLSINTPTLATLAPAVGEPGTSATIALTGTRFVAPMTINAGTGITVTNVVIASPTNATAAFTIAANTSLAGRDVTVTTSEGTSNAITFAIPPAITTGQRVSGTLATTDQISPIDLYHYADLYRLTLATSTSVVIDLRSTAFDAYLRIISSTGAELYSDDDTGGSGNSRISQILAAGTYYIEATAYAESGIGDYTLSINMPVLSSVSPRFRIAGTSTSLTLTGSNFVAPMTFDAGSDITVISVAVASSTSATANITIPSGATLGNRNVTVTTAAGTSNTATFKIVPTPQTITVGQTLSGALTPTDITSTEVPNSYQDLYQLVLPAQQMLTFDVQATAFDPLLYILSSISGSSGASNDNGGTNGNSRLVITLPAGTYFLEVTSPNPGSTGAYTISVGGTALTNISPRFGSADTPMNVTLTGAGFSNPLTINAGAGITASSVVVASGTSATATLTIDPSAAAGVRDLTVTTTGTSNPLRFTVYASIPTISIGQQIRGTLTTTDLADPSVSSIYSDMYKLVVPSSTAVIVDLTSTVFNTWLDIIPAVGSTLSNNDVSSGNTNSRITTTLAAGTYFINVTSLAADLGDYTLTVGTAPTLSSITPNSGAVGSTFGITLTGTALVLPIAIEAGIGVTFSNVTILSPTSAIATVTIAANAAVGTRPFSVTTPYGTTGSVNFTVTAPPSSSLNFPRVFSPSDLGFTGFAIMNPGATTANVTFTLYSAAGTSVGTSSQTVPPGGQLSKLGNELFTNATQSGWIRATSSTVGLQSFWAGGNFTTYMDAAAAAPASQTVVFPLVTPQSEINVANAGTGSNTVTFRVYGAAGTELATAVTQNIATNGIYSVNAAALFPSVNFTANTATIRATGTLNVTGTSVTTDYPIAPSWAILNGVDASLSLFEVDFPHVPSGPTNGGPAWQTVLGLTNISTSSQTVTITFTHNSGATTQVTRTIAGSGTIRETIHSLFGFASAYQEGWIRVTGTSAINGFIVYGYTGTGGAAAVPAQGTAQTKLIFSHVANGPGWGTGLALLNATTTDATVQVYVMNPSGTLVGGAANVPTATFTLPAETKVSKLINELVPAALFNGGFVFVRTSNNVPIYGTELFFTSDVQVLANVAAGILDPSIDYQPPTQ